MTGSPVGLVDYGMGNLLSVRSALETLGATVALCTTPADVEAAGRLVLPGVGAFGDCVRNLASRGLDAALRRAVLVQRTPLLGICLGMQALARKSQEAADGPGLGLVAGDVVRLDDDGGRLRIPHIGWNNVHHRAESPMFVGVPDGIDLYFVHSYAVRLDEASQLEATTQYGAPVTAAIRTGPVWGTQFHPEKSQRHGLRILQNFLDWQPEA